jgi:hypothetical protein
MRPIVVELRGHPASIGAQLRKTGDKLTPLSRVNALRKSAPLQKIEAGYGGLGCRVEEQTSCREELHTPIVLSRRTVTPTIAMAVSRRASPRESARSAHTLQHTPPSLAITDLHPVAFQFEGTRLVGVGEIRR